MSKLSQLVEERSEIYGDPKESHASIGLIWTAILREWAPKLCSGFILPEHVVAQMLLGMKLSRMRKCFKLDNYDDLQVYSEFAKKWQEDYDQQESFRMRFEEQTKKQLRHAMLYKADPS